MDQVDMNSSINEYLASLDPFRLAHPSTPLPWPRDETAASDSNNKLFQSLLPNIIDFLNSQRVSISTIKFTQQYRLISDMRNTVSILTDNENTTTWSEMIQRIYDMFPLKQRSTLQIEIENPRLACRPSNVCGEIDENALSSYLSITSGLQDFMIECPPRIFLGFGCFLRQQQANSIPKSTLVVHVHEKAEYDWRTLDAFSRKITKSTKLSFEIRPAIPEDKVLLDQLFSNPTEKKFPLKPFNGAAINGVDISSPGTCKLGTLGGSLVLRPKNGVRSTRADAASRIQDVERSHLIFSRPGQTPTDPDSLFCVMTNDHVIRNENNDSHLRTGFAFNPESPTGPIIRYPCDQRYGAYMSGIGELVHEDIKTYGPLLIALEKRKAKRDLGRVFVSSGNTASTVDCSRNEHDDCIGKNCRLCASIINSENFPCGNSECKGEHRLQDWAAIKIPVEMMFVNKTPSIDRDRLPPGTNYKPSVTINATTDVEVNSYVLKNGAKTGVTCGQLTPKYHRLRDDQDIGPPGSSTRYTAFFETYFAVIGKKYSAVEEEQPSFSAKGDSGAWVIDLEGRLVGLLRAGLKDSVEKPVVDFISPIKEVFAQLEQKTDCYVDLPIAMTTERGLIDILLNRYPITVYIQA